MPISFVSTATDVQLTDDNGVVKSFNKNTYTLELNEDTISIGKLEIDRNERTIFRSYVSFQWQEVSSPVELTAAALYQTLTEYFNSNGAVITGDVTITGDVNIPEPLEVDGAVSINNFPATQQISGTINVGNLPANQTVSGTVNIGNLPVNQSVTQGTSPWVVSGTSTVSGSVSVSNFPATQPVSGTIGVNNFPAIQEVSGTVWAEFPLNGTDAAGRLRVSIPTPQVSIKYHNDKLPLLVDEIINGTAMSVRSSVNSCVALSVATAGDYVIRQTYKKGNYISGVALTAEFTTSAFHVEAGKTKRRGYYSSSVVAPYDTAYDGLSLYNNGSTINLNVHRSGTLTASATQAEWDDPLDGTGPSGVTVDWSKGQICAFDFIWLGFGRVSFWMNFNGKFYLIHTFYFSNDTEYPYMSSPNQPIRTELRSISGAGTLNEVCASVYADDGAITESLTGYPFGISSSSTPVTATTGGITYAMLGVRLKSTNLEANVLISEMTMNNTSNVFGVMSLIRNPTVANTFTYSAVTNANFEYAVGVSNNTVTGGTVIGTWSIDRNLSSVLKTSIAKLLDSGIAGTPNEYVLCITPSGNNLTWTSTINLTELI